MFVCELQMGVENLSGQYVRAVYPFDTSHPREISLSKGDIVKVVSVIDDNWYCGEFRGRKGNFPSSYVETLSLPAVEDGQKLYGAIENFPAQQGGDLEFRKGMMLLKLIISKYVESFCFFILIQKNCLGYMQQILFSTPILVPEFGRYKNYLVRMNVKQFFFKPKNVVHILIRYLCIMVI